MINQERTWGYGSLMRLPCAMP